MSSSDLGTPSSPSTSSPGSSPPHSVHSTPVNPGSAGIPSKSPSSASHSRSHSRRFSNLGSLQQQVPPSSPLSSASSATHRRRQSSFSSNVSTTTDATSYDGSGEECVSQDGHGEKDANSAPSSPAPVTANAPKRIIGSNAPDYPPTGGGLSNLFVHSGSSPHAVSIPPSSTLPLSVSTALPSASVRLSTTPLFPSPLAQASGPDEDHEQHRGDEGDAESGDDENERLDSEPAWSGKVLRSSSRDASAPFGGKCYPDTLSSLVLHTDSWAIVIDLELSPPAATIPLPDVTTLSLESNLTPRPVNPTRQRHSPTSPIEGDPSRTARATRVRSLGRASGLSQAISAADDAAALSNAVNRRSRHGDLSGFVGASGIGGSSSGSGGTHSLNSTPTRSSTLSNNSISSMSTSPPSPSASSNLSVSPSTVSRRASLNLASPPRFFQPGSPTGAARNSSRTSISYNNPLPIPIPAPFPAAPPPSESIKLQRVPESVRSALDFRHSGLSSSYSAGDNFGSLSRSFQAGSPVDLKLPKTPTATRAPSPASASGASSPSDGRSVPVSQGHSREGSRRASRQSSREKLSAFGGSPSTVTTPSTPATSAFSPLFPFQTASPGMTRSRSKSMSTGGPSTPLRQDLFRPPQAHSDDPVSPRSSAQQGLGVSPSFFRLESPRGSSLHPRTASDSYSSSGPINHRASASTSGIAAPPSRLVNHRLSIAPTGTTDSTDEYAQIILSTRNAKVRKWRPASPAPEAGGGSGIKSWSLAGGRNNSTLGEQMEEGADDELEPETVAGPPKEIEWVDWLDEYRKMKEAKLRADGANTAGDAVDKVCEGADGDKSQEGASMIEREPKKERSPTRSEGSDRKSESSRLAEPALATAQKGKAKATTATEFNPFEATTASMNRRDLEPRPFLTPGVSYSSPYFPLTATSTSTSPVLFHPSTTATPLMPSEHYDFTALKPATSHSNSGSSYVGSPGVKRKRNFAKLGNKIDAWWSAVRTSFAGAEDERGPRHRRTSIDQPSPYLTTTASIEPSVSRTSSQYVRPSTPGTPGLRNVASAYDLVRVTSSTSPSSSYSSSLVPRGALAPAARSQSTGRLRPPPDRQRTVSSGSEQEGSDAGTSKTRRNPNLSLNLGPSFNSMVRQPKQPAQAYLSNKVSPHTDTSTSPATKEAFGLSPPVADTPPSGPRSAPENIPRPVVIPQAGLSSSPGFSPAESPVWDRTPALVPSAAHFPIRARQVTMPNKLPSEQTAKEQEKEKQTAERQGFSMHTVRSQIRQRLASAKESCDNELRRIVEGISTFVEKDLQQDIGTPMPAVGFDEGRFGELVQDDLAGGYTSSPDVESEGEAMVETDHADSDGGSGTRRPPSRLKHSHLSPSSDTSPSQRRSVDAGVARRTSLVPRHRHLTSVPRDGSSSRSKPGSNSSSRSNSRSRSPLPPGLRRSSGQRSPAPGFLLAANSKLAEGAFIVLLQEIITVATEILDTPINKLTARPGSCAEYIGKVQQIGEAWNENPELPCRGWYVQILLAVAGLSRVVEWWEAEKGFWSFDEADNEDAEPILFISKGNNSEDSPEIRARADTLSVPALSPSSQPPRWSPLGIDLGLPDDTGDARSTRSRDPTASFAPEETKHRAEELKHAVEAITAQTLLMELSLDGQLFQYLSSAWQDLVGVDPDECLDTPISDFLFPDDAAVFAEATRQLEADDSHTVEVNFRLRVASSSQASQEDDEESPEDLYEAMEGKGMLMLDGLSGSASHTMWVVRPAPFSETAAQTHESLARFGLDTFHRRSSSDPGVFLAPGARINLEPILCRICERPTPAWFFEKHNETCNEVHRLEGDISECNDRLKDLLRTLGELVVALDQARKGNDVPPEYRGIPLDLSMSPLPSPAASGPSEESRQRSQHYVFDHVRDIVETALSISTPSVTDESGDIPIQDQRLLSPHSESNLAAILHWQRPRIDDAALVRLLSDTEESIRFKLNSVNRLRNTILYAEKVRQEWESKASEAIFAAQEKEQAEHNATLPFESPQLQPLPPSDDHPKGMELLELPRPTQTLRRQISQTQGLLSPMLLPEDSTSQLSVSPSAQLALSPRLPSAVPSSRTRASSIKDFKILKPISKGAFGSVYLAKKVTTGDYYAIKVLKKSDMVAKNQVTNVKAERMILMTTAESNFVVKLYYTFQSKDYLYLVMEYLNGGDCGALVKNLGGLTEDWAKKYVAEVVVGLEHLHSSGIIHRDLKPDNLLIDAKGHLKLTDFGLSRIGLLGRQTQIPGIRDAPPHARRPSASTRTSSNNHRDFSTSSSPLATPALGNAAQTSYFGNVPLTDSFSLDTPSESSASGSLHVSSRGNTLSPTWPAGSSRPLASAGPPGAGAETSKQHFVGTPDYLAPESILGIGMDACVDWWALGVICYEFIYGFPPFHDETPEKVFDNILSRRFDWHEGEIEISSEARDFIDRLLCTDARRRLGAHGAEDVKAHPFLDGVDWDNLLKGPVEFVPNVDDPESTDYFDARGAQTQNFNDEEPDPSVADDPAVRQTQGPTPASTPGLGREPRDRSETAPNPHDDFGTFSFRNLTVLKQANDDMIRKMKDEQLLPPLTNPLSIPVKGHNRSRNNSVDARDPVSPSSHSTSSIGSQPFRAGESVSSSPLARPSPDSSLIERSRPRQPVVGFHPRSSSSHHARRNSMPSRLRKSSVTATTEDDRDQIRDEVKKAVLTENWAAHSRRTSNNNGLASALSSPERDPRSLPPLRVPSPQTPEARSAPIGSLPDEMSNRLPPPAHPAAIDCLVAGRNPIVTKVLETMLQRLGCRVVVVPNGAEAILAAGGIPFDVLFLDLKMAVVDGEKAARMIKSTVNPSAQAPIVAVCSHPAAIDDAAGTLFTATLSKPIMKADLLHVLSYLGFKLETKGDVLRRGSGDSGAVPHPDFDESDTRRRGST